MMNSFTLAVCLIAVVGARPEAENTYISGFPPNYLDDASPLNHGLNLDEHSFSNFAAPQHTLEEPADGATHNVDYHMAPIVPEEITPPDVSFNNQDSYNIAYQTSSRADASGYIYPPAETIHKHIYVHVPPKDFEEDDVIKPRFHLQGGSKQKHYKIVFIKAPSSPTIQTPILPPLPQNEEKTLIYVLHKKQDDIQDIVIPPPIPTQPSKPEVYYIKYKTKKEERPLYGPPPANIDIDPRHGWPTMRYGSPVISEQLVDKETVDLTVPLTTIQPSIAEQVVQNEISSHIDVNATIGSIETHSTVTTAELNGQYLAPEPAPTAAIIDEQQHVPAQDYGPPKRRIIKKKK